MAITPLRAESAQDNPAANFLHARQLLDIARKDALEDVDSDEEVNLLGFAQVEAADALLSLPAPDEQALAFKLAVFRDEEFYRRDGDTVVKCLNGFIADIERFAAGGVA